jgi:hypothetical protein
MKQVVRPSNELHSQYMSSSDASRNASHLQDSLSLLTCALHHQQQQQDEEDTRLGPATTIPAIRKPPTFEAPSWAVPARGETRLEVSTRTEESVEAR